MSQQINLYDPTLERKRDWLALTNVVIGGVGLAVLVGAAGLLARQDLPALTAQSSSGDSQLKAMRDQVTALGQRGSRKADPRLEQQLAAKREWLALRGEVLATLRSSLGPGAASYAEYLRGFARQTVSGLWLTGFSVRAGNGIEIRGNTVDPALLPEYIRRLNQEAAFQGQTFAALTLDRPKPATTATTGGAAGAAAGLPRWHEFTLIPNLDGMGRHAPVPKVATTPVAGGAS